MVERIADMPPGTLGFRGVGELTEADFSDEIAPAIAETLDADDQALDGIRLLLITPPGFGTSDVTAAANLLRQTPEAHLGHRRDWKRIAIVTESNSLRRSARVWTRLIPVDVKLFKPTEEPAARRWLQNP